MALISGGLPATAAVKLFAIATGILTTAVSARVLGPADRGLFAATTTWATVIAVVTGLSLQQIATHRLAARVNYLSDIRAKISRFTMVSAGIGGVIVVAVAALYPSLRGGLSVGLVVTAAIIAAGFSRETLNNALLLAVGRLDLHNRAVVVGRSLVLVSVATPLLFGWGVNLALAFLAAGTAASAFFSGALLAKSEKVQNADRQAVKLSELLRDTLKLHPNALAALLYSSAGILILNVNSSPDDVAYFSLATQMMSVMMFPAQAVGTASYALAGEHGTVRALPLQFELFKKLFLVMCLLVAVSFVLAEPFIVLLAGEDFRPAGKAFRLLLPSVIGMTLMEAMAPQWITRGLFGLSSSITLAVGLVSLISLLVLVPRLGIRGAIIAHWITYAFAILGNGSFALYLRRNLKQSLQ